MASLGVVQAKFEIDAGKSISTLNQLGQTSEKAAGQLKKVGEVKPDDNVVKWAEAQKRALMETGKLSEEQARKIAAMRADMMRSFSSVGATPKFEMPKNIGNLSEGAQAIFDRMGQSAASAEAPMGRLQQMFTRLEQSGGLAGAAMKNFYASVGLVSIGLTAAVKSAAMAATGIIAFANGVKYGYKLLEGFVKKDPTLDMFRRVEEYQSKLAKLNASASHQDTGLSKGTYDRLATEFSTYANVTKTEALEIAKNLTLVGNVGQKMGAKIRQGTKIGEEAIKEVDNIMKMLPDYAAVIGKNFRDPKELGEAVNNLRIAFSSMDNLKELASHYKLFTEEQQKSIENTLKLKGETEALSEALGYLPENLKGVAEAATTPLEKAYDTMKSTVRTAWDEFAKSLDWNTIGGQFGELLTTLGDKLASIINVVKERVGPIIKDVASSLVTGIKESVDWLYKYLGNSDAFQGLIDGVLNVVEAFITLEKAAYNLTVMGLDFAAWVAEITYLDEALWAVFKVTGSIIGVVADLVSIAVDGWRLIGAGLNDLWAAIKDSSPWQSLLNGINSAIDWFSNLSDKATGFINGIKNAISNMFSAASYIIPFIKDSAKEAVANATGTVKMSLTGIADTSAGEGLKVALEKTTTATENLGKTVTTENTKLGKTLSTWKPTSGGGGGGGRRGGGGGRGGKSDADKQAERDAKNAERYLKNLREQAQEISRMTKLERLHYDLQEGAVKLSGDQLKQAEEFARAIDDRVRLQRQERVEIELANQAMQNRRSLEDQMRNISNIGVSYNMSDRQFGLFQQRQQLDIDYQRQLEDLAHRERQELVGKSNEEIQVTRDKYRRLRALAEDYHNTRVNLWQQEVTETEKFATDIAANVRKGIKEVGDWYNSLGKDIQNATVSWAERCSDAIATFVRKGKFDFKSLADSILDDVTRMASRQFTSGLFSLFGSLFGGGGGYVFDSGFNSLIGLASGGYTGHGGKYQPAGIVHKGEFVINANSTRKLGLDFLNALNSYATGGYVTPLPSIVKSGSLDESNHLGGGVTVNVYNQTNSQVTARRNNTTGAIDVFVRQAVDAVADSISTGGIVANAMQNTYALNRGAGTQRTGF